MAIVLLGSTNCPICGNILYDSESIHSFTSFIANGKDKLHLFNDVAFHTSCLQQHPDGQKVILLADECHHRFMLKTCKAGGNVITDYHNHVFLPLLTSDEAEELFQFNFLMLDRNNIARWSDKERFVAAVSKFIAEGKWEDVTPEYNYWQTMMKAMALSAL